MPLVSVIIPAFNHSKYIRAALESVHAQSWPEIELIALDDCSPDETFQQASDFLANPDIRSRFQNIICEKNDTNMGAAATLNRGLQKASGQWLTILNSDDCYAPSRIERMITSLTDANKQYGFSNIELMDENGEAVFEVRFADLFAALPDRIAASPNIGFLILDENIAHTSGNLIFSRSIYEKAGGFIDLALSHDWEYLIRLLAIEEPLFFPEPLYRYRIHGTNTSSGVRFSKIFDPLIIYGRYFRAVARGDYENPLYPCYRRGENKLALDAWEKLIGTASIDHAAIRKKLEQW